MALMTRYNPPPNWPPPPAGWAPPPSWQPDPSWGPPPEGWPLWVRERANPRAWLWSFVFAGAFYLVILIVALIGTGGRINPQTAGAVLVPFLMGGLVTGIIAWTRPKRWSIWLYPPIVFAISLGVSVISNLGRAAS